MAQCRILVVEDEPLIATEIAGMLAAMGCHTVGPVAAVHQALVLIDTEPVDAAILDVNVSDGYITPVAERLLDRGIPVLLATGYEVFALSERLMSLPRLQKPYTSDQFMREVRNIRAQAIGRA